MTFAIDTNVFVYAVGSGDRRNAPARNLVELAFTCDAVVPVQVLAEFNNVCRRKAVLTANAAIARTTEWQTLFVVPQTSAANVISAADAARRYGIQYFDALILTVAKEAGATVLLSEDMHDGALYDGVRIVNPFDDANAAAVAALLAA